MVRQLQTVFSFVLITASMMCLPACLPTEDELDLDIHPFDEAYDKPCGFLESVEYENFESDFSGREGIKVTVRYRINYEVVEDIEARVDTIRPNTTGFTFRGEAKIRNADGELYQFYPKQFTRKTYPQFYDSDVFEGEFTIWPDAIGDANEFCYNFYFRRDGFGIDEFVRTNERNNGCETFR
ncbi:MAG: hypothetical protein AAFZ63_21845 [Bacteroidota bacterium]